MRVLLFSSLVALAYGYSNNADYIRLDFHGPGIDATGNSPAGCAVAVTRSFLVKPVKVGHNLAETASKTTQWTYSADRHGSCINYLLATDDPLFTPGGAFALSFAIVDAGSGIYNSWTFAAAECSIIGVAQVSGFNFSPNSTGSTDCSGVTGTDNDVGGLVIAHGAQVIETKGTLFLASRAIQGQLSGPFTTNTCALLVAGNAASLPITVPLEDKVATLTALNEYAVTVTGFCTLMHTAGGVNIMRTKISATKGELSFEISSGSNVAYTSRAVCTNGDTYSRITFTAALNGSFGHCVQAKDASGVIQASKFYTFTPDGESIGDWPSFPDPVCPTCTTCSSASPATALHISATMAVIYALIGMMM